MSGAWVFHRGSLGDCVLLWPVLRALRAGGREVTLVTDASKAALAQAELGITGVSAERPEFNAMWVAGSAARPVHGVGLVLSFLANPATEAGRTWLASAAIMFPEAEIVAEAQRVDRVVALEYGARFGGPVAIPVRRNATGPVVIHVGAGSEEKRLPLEWWLEFVGKKGRSVRLVAGEVEGERFSARERDMFAAAGGDYPGDLASLAAILRGARLYLGADTGPTHLAAAMGVPTVAFFGPTDSARWAPIGPRVRVARVPAAASKKETPVGAD